MPLSVTESPASPPETLSCEPGAPANLLEKIEDYKHRLLDLVPLLARGEDAAEARRTVERVLRAQRDELVRTTLALRSPDLAA
jgi:hypothetical protein